MCEVVLDEGILIRALQCETGPGGGPAPAGIEPHSINEAAELLAHVQRQCIWVFTFDIVEVYKQRLFHAPYKGAVWTYFFTSFWEVLATGDRTLMLDEPPQIEDAYHHKDRRWVSAAAAAPPGCLLITVDGNLVAQLHATSLEQAHQFIAMMLHEGYIRVTSVHCI